MKTLTVTKAAKNLYSCLKTVYHKHESFELVEDGIPYAHLVPVSGANCNTHQLADDLAPAALGTDDRRALAAAIRKGRKNLKPLKNPWG